MRWFSLILRNVRRRPGRSALTICGLALAVLTVVALVGIARGFERSMAQLYQARGIDIVVLRAGGVTQLGTGLDERLGEKIARLPDVRLVSPGLADMIALDQYDMFGVLVRGLAPGGPEFDDVRVVEGRLLADGDEDAVMLGHVLAGNLGKRVGETIELIEGRPLRIVGIYETFSLYENGSVLMLLGPMQRLLQREGEVSGFAVVCRRKDEASVRRLCDEIARLGPRIEAMPTSRFLDSIVDLRRARAMAWFVSTVALLVGAIGTLNTMSMSVFERRREIAVLRALGWRKSRVVRMILGEAVVLALAGAVVGTVGAWGWLQALTRWTAAGRLVSGQIAPSVVLHALAVAVLIGLFGGLYPSILAARVAPAEGMRYE